MGHTSFSGICQHCMGKALLFTVGSIFFCVFSQIPPQLNFSIFIYRFTLIIITSHLSNIWSGHNFRILWELQMCLIFCKISIEMAVALGCKWVWHLCMEWFVPLKMYPLFTMICPLSSHETGSIIRSMQFCLIFSGKTDLIFSKCSSLFLYSVWFLSSHWLALDWTMVGVGSANESSLGGSCCGEDGVTDSSFDFSHFCTSISYFYTGTRMYFLLYLRVMMSKPPMFYLLISFKRVLLEHISQWLFSEA